MPSSGGARQEHRRDRGAIGLLGPEPFQPRFSSLGGRLSAVLSISGINLDDLAQDGLTPSDYRFAAIDGQLSAPDLASLPSARA
jgi:hypothetical protein